ncbi:unnamed protein product [Adineta ricciae]|uniref:Pentapeptide repeat-containing protein n=1 Tax=Adineta ricciae TaxID=249248 RepID=A0A815TKP5_ADIRI|nr:unnamed protein product [Adineta ricciae]
MIRNVLRDKPPLSRDSCCVRFFGLEKCSFLSIISTILLPSIIAAATIILSEHQSNLAQKNREKDIDLARQQREQDFDLANRTRVQTHELEENRRRQDRELANEMRVQDLLIANNIRQDGIVSTFIRETSELLIRQNFSLDFYNRMMVLRPKILTVFRQLDDPKRKYFVIQFLHESRLIVTGKNPLDMTGVDLTGVDFSSPFRRDDRRSRMWHISLVGAIIVNASFVSRDIRHCNFTETFADGANFTASILFDVLFYQASLRSATFFNAGFSTSEFMGADLTGADLRGLYTGIPDFDRDPFPFIGAILPDGRKLKGQNLIVAGNAEKVTTGFDCFNFERKPSLGDILPFWIRENDKVITMPYGMDEVRKGCYFTAKPSQNFSRIYQLIDMKRYSKIIQYGEAYFKFQAYIRSPRNTRSCAFFEYMDEKHVRLGNLSLSNENKNGSTQTDVIHIHQSTRYMEVQLIFEPNHNNSLTQITMMDDIEFRLVSLRG